MSQGTRCVTVDNSISKLLVSHIPSGATRSLSRGVLEFCGQGPIPCLPLPFPALPCAPSSALTLPSPIALDLSSTPLTLNRGPGYSLEIFWISTLLLKSLRWGWSNFCGKAHPLLLFLSPCVRSLPRIPRLCYKWPALHSTHLISRVSGVLPRNFLNFYIVVDEFYRISDDIKM